MVNSYPGLFLSSYIEFSDLYAKIICLLGINILQDLVMYISLHQSWKLSIAAKFVE